MRIVVTGASGFVGLNVVEAALARGEEVVAAADTPLPAEALAAFARLPGRLRVETLDVVDAAAVRGLFERHRPQTLFHGAALTPGPLQERERAARTLQVNIAGTAIVLDAAARVGVERVVYPSSVAVYGTNAFSGGLLDEETTVPQPQTIYAITKYAGEKTALRFREIAGLNIVAARLGQVFGPWERETGVRETLAPMWQILSLAERGEEAVLPRRCARDFVYSRDVAGAVLALLDRRDAEPAIVNVGPGRVWAVEEWCAEAARALPGLRWRLARPGEAGNVNLHGDRDRAAVAVHRLTGAVGFTPTFFLAESARDYAEWWQQTLRARRG